MLLSVAAVLSPDFVVSDPLGQLPMLRSVVFSVQAPIL